MTQRAFAARAAAVLVAVVCGCSSAPRSNQERLDAAGSPGQFSCGTYELAAGVSTGGATEQQCLLDAFNTGIAASMRFRELTVEGDPVIYDYVVTGLHLVEVTVDSSHDHHGGSNVTQTTQCTTLETTSRALHADNCSPTSSTVPPSSSQ